MDRFEEINKIVDEIGDADTLFEFAEKVYDKDQEIADLQHKLKVSDKAVELACKYNIPDDEHSHITLRFSDTGVQVESWQELKEYALKQAEKEVKGE